MTNFMAKVEKYFPDSTGGNLVKTIAQDSGVFTLVNVKCDGLDRSAGYHHVVAEVRITDF